MDHFAAQGPAIEAVLGGPDGALSALPDGAIWILEDEGAGRLLRLTPED